MIRSKIGSTALGYTGMKPRWCATCVIKSIATRTEIIDCRVPALYPGLYWLSIPPENCISTLTMIRNVHSKQRSRYIKYIHRAGEKQELYRQVYVWLGNAETCAVLPITVPRCGVVHDVACVMGISRVERGTRRNQIRYSFESLMLFWLQIWSLTSPGITQYLKPKK